MDAQPTGPADHIDTSVDEQPDTTPVSDELSSMASAILSNRRLHCLKNDDLFGVFDQTGDILWGQDIADGLYYRDTRYLSGLTFRLEDQRPILLSSVVRENNIMMSVNLTNENLSLRNGTRLAHDLLHVLRSRFLWKGGCYERIEIRNFDTIPHEIVCDMRFFADFADLFEARGMKRTRRGNLFNLFWKTTQSLFPIKVWTIAPGQPVCGSALNRKHYRQIGQRSVSRSNPEKRC